jgi:hypothetical protein
MKKWLYVLILSGGVVFYGFSFAGQETQAEPNDVEQKTQEKSDVPWERFNLNLGVFLGAVDSSLGIGGNNIGIDVDLEDALGLDTSISAFRIDALWRFTDNRRHRLDFSWFDLNRDATKVLGRPVEIGGSVFPIGATVKSELDMKIFKASYSYSFFQDDRFDLAASFGLFVVPIEYEIDAQGFSERYEADTLTAPLPVIGLRGDFAITPKLFLKMNLDAFYLEFDRYEGSILDVRLALEYNLFKNVGFGLGFEHLEVDAEAENSDLPMVDFNGNIMFDYSGIQLYTKIYF